MSNGRPVTSCPQIESRRGTGTWGKLHASACGLAYVEAGLNHVVSHAAEDRPLSTSNPTAMRSGTALRLSESARDAYRETVHQSVLKQKDSNEASNTAVDADRRRVEWRSARPDARATRIASSGCKEPESTRLDSSSPRLR